MTVTNDLARETKRIAYSKLVLTEKNIRKVSTTADQDKVLDATVHSQGIILPLIVVENDKGKFEVFDGGRRLQSYGRGIDAKIFKKSDDLECIVAGDEGDALILSAELTFSRAGLSEIDELEAYKAAYVELGSQKKVSEHFGISKDRVRRILELSKVNPDILDLQRKAEKVDMDLLKVLTRVSDHEQQMSFYNEAVEEADQWDDPADVLRWKLDENQVDEDHRLVTFVGEEAYKAAGGNIIQYLFDDRKAIYTDVPLLHKLMEDRLKAEVEARKDDWADVSYKLDQSFFMGRCAEGEGEIEGFDREAAALELEVLENKDEDDFTEEDGERYRELDRQLSEPRPLTDEQRQSLGCMLYCNSQGELVVKEGLILQTEEDTDQSTTGTDTGTKPVDKGPQPDITKNGQNLLCVARGYIGTDAIARNPKLAYDIMAYELALICVSSFNGHWWPEHVLKLGAQTHGFSANDEDGYRGKIASGLRDLYEGLDTSWTEAEEWTDRFDDFRLISEEDKVQFVALGTALTLDREHDVDTSAPNYQMVDHVISIAQEENHTVVRDYWKPDADFLSCGRKPYLESLTVKFSNEEITSRAPKMKVKEHVAHLAEGFAMDRDELEMAVASADNHPLNPALVEEFLSWVPEKLESIQPKSFFEPEFELADNLTQDEDTARSTMPQVAAE